MDLSLRMSPDQPLGLTAVLQAAAAELSHLATVADGLGVCQAGNAEQWQSLDRMSQHLGELSTFLAAVSDAVPDFRPDLAEALAGVRVGKLAQRLAASPSFAEEDVSGELEMFGD